MRYVCCQPATDYYTWQIEIVINNFKKHGINPNFIDIVCGIENGKIPENWIKLANHYNTVRFFFYEDSREDKGYAPSIYFNLLKQHVKARDDVKFEILYLHDSDIVFTKTPDFSEMEKGNAWYLSDTNSYINYDYVTSKGYHIYEKMCEIIGISTLIPKLMNHNSGGAQYIVKNTTYEFWNKVELDAVKLYKYFCEEEPNYVKKDENDYPIQKWTAGMWSVLYNAWVYGHETIVDKRMDFGWVTDHKDSIEKYTVLHNSGVVNNRMNLFHKGSYHTKLPYNDILEIDPHSACTYYWQEVQETGKVSIL
jgi:hypothetical protein